MASLSMQNAVYEEQAQRAERKRMTPKDPTYIGLHNRGHVLITVGPFKDDDAAKSWFRRVGGKAYFGYRHVGVLTPEQYEEPAVS